MVFPWVFGSGIPGGALFPGVSSGIERYSGLNGIDRP